MQLLPYRGFAGLCLIHPPLDEEWEDRSFVFLGLEDNAIVSHGCSTLVPEYAGETKMCGKRTSSIYFNEPHSAHCIICFIRFENKKQINKY